MTNDARRGRREGAISLKALRCFAAVVEGGSISRAAEILGLSQPTACFAMVRSTSLLFAQARATPTVAIEATRRRPGGCA